MCKREGEREREGDLEKVIESVTEREWKRERVIEIERGRCIEREM